METYSRRKPELSGEYQEFWRIRGGNALLFDLSPRPTKEEDIEKAKALTVKLLDILKDNRFGKIRQNLVSLAADWIRDGLITEAQHMEIIRTHEVLTLGQTTETWLASRKEN